MDLTGMVNDERRKFRKLHDGAEPTKLDVDIRIELTVASTKGVLGVRAKAGTRKLVGECSVEYAADPMCKSKYIE